MTPTFQIKKICEGSHNMTNITLRYEQNFMTTSKIWIFLFVILHFVLTLFKISTKRKPVFVDVGVIL